MTTTRAGQRKSWFVPLRGSAVRRNHYLVAPGLAPGPEGGLRLAIAIMPQGRRERPFRGDNSAVLLLGFLCGPAPKANSDEPVGDTAGRRLQAALRATRV